MNNTSITRVERWLSGEHGPPSEGELAGYLLCKLEAFYPERRSPDGELTEEAGTPPSHAYMYRVARELANACMKRAVLR